MLSAYASRTRRYQSLTVDDLVDLKKILVSIDDRESRACLDLWGALSGDRDPRLVRVDPLGVSSLRAELSSGDRIEASLYNDDEIAAILGEGPLLIDVTGMEHPVWASLLRVCYERKISTKFLYAEPEEYKSHLTPSSVGQYDLSIRLGGLSPLPGYAQLQGALDEEKTLFVPALGFEGNRPECLMVGLDPAPHVVPIVGVPGFQFEYPSVTIGCNRDFLDAQSAHADIKMARASCPFDFIRVLREVACDFPDHYMYLGMVGTRPHALGAAVFWLMNKASSEVMFDHPIKRYGRTSGVGVIHVYDFGCFDVRF